MTRRPRARNGLRIRLIALIGLGLAGCQSGQPLNPLQWSDVGLTSRDRLLILAPHPDDEVVGCAGIIQQAVAMGIPIRMVFLTYGDNNEWAFLLFRKRPVIFSDSVQRMGEIRHDEAVAAAHVLGVAPSALTFLGYPDFGTLHIWEDHWGDRPPFRSMLTRVTAVPYPNALRPGAPYKGESVIDDLVTILREARPTKVFVSHPADYNPDHRALYLYTRVALWQLAGELSPDVFPFLIHHKRWPKPRGYRPTELLKPPPALATTVAWHAHILSPVEVKRKVQAIHAHRTQYGYSARYLLSFARVNELFGDFPPVTLRADPTPMPLSSGSSEDARELPEELTEQERAVFVGVEERTVQRDGDDLVLSMNFSRPLAPAVGASVYIFGYRADRPFGRMPKLHVKCGAMTHAVYDQDARLPSGVLTVALQPKHLSIRVPLRVLGDPERILTSARTYLGDVPLDWVSWRVVEVAADHAAARTH